MDSASADPASIHSRFLRGVDFIEEHLLEPVALADAAKQAGFSLHYFSRLFRVLTGEPFVAYLRRRRMTVAAERLAAEGPGLRLVDLAFDCGYDSQEAFTRAFKRTFGRTPGAFRRAPVAGKARWRPRIDAEALAHLHQGLCMEPVIRELEAFVVAGVRARFDEENRHGIPALWTRFQGVVARIPHPCGDSGIGLCVNADFAEGTLDYVAGVEVERVGWLPRGVCAELVPRQTYAIFTHHIRSLPLHVEVQPTYRWIFGTWLPASPFEYLGGPDFERYPPEFEPGVTGGSIEICLPVRRRA